MQFFRRHSRTVRTVVPAVVAALALAAGSAAQAAPAVDSDPIPDFTFSDCPELSAEYTAQGSFCFVVTVTSGSFVLGGIRHGITEPITFTFASAYNPTTFRWTTLFGKMRADSFPLDLGSDDPMLSNVHATPEYAGGIDVVYPEISVGVKFKLTNQHLGSDCTVGDEGDPIALDMTTGTTDPPPPNTPISGVPFKIVGSIPHASIRQATHVDNAFAVPAARGCGPDGQSADAAVNAAAGLPSAAGHNTMIFNNYAVARSYITLP